MQHEPAGRHQGPVGQHAACYPQLYCADMHMFVQAALESQDLSCTYLAHDELERVIIIIIIIVIIIIIIIIIIIFIIIIIYCDCYYLLLLLLGFTLLFTNLSLSLLLDICPAHLQLLAG